MTIRIALLYFIFISIGATAQNQNEKSKPEPRLLLKTGSTFNADFNFENNSFGFIHAETEILLSANSGIRVGVEASGGQTVNELERKFPFTAYRRYFEPVTGSGISNYSGAYLGALAYLGEKKIYVTDEEASVFNTELLTTNRVFIPHGGVGLELGRQTFGIFDFGVFAGAEYMTERLTINEREVQVQRVFSPMLKSYNRLMFPLALSRDFYQNISAYSKPSFSRKHLLKFGLDDVFAFSKKGLFFHPKIVFEQNLGNSYFSGLVKASGLMARAKYYDIIRFDSVSEISERSYLNQTVAFNGSAQVRYYAVSGLKKNQNYLNGIYLCGEAAWESGSTEVKRQYWSFEKFSNYFFGGGLGLQQQLFNDLLIDAHLAIGKASGPALVKAGLEVYWLK